jgi:threonine dehydratase
MNLIPELFERIGVIKLERLRAWDADVRFCPGDFDLAKDAARAFAAAEGLPFFEDGAAPLQYDGYAAIADELLAQCPPQPAAVVVPIGNGALAAGVGRVVGERSPATVRVGVVAKEMPVMARSFSAGRAVDVPAGSTIADGLAASHGRDGGRRHRRRRGDRAGGCGSCRRRCRL